MASDTQKVMLKTFEQSRMGALGQVQHPLSVTRQLGQKRKFLHYDIFSTTEKR